MLQTRPPNRQREMGHGRDHQPEAPQPERGTLLSRVVKRARRNSYPVKKPGRHGTRHDASAAIKLLNPVLAREKSAPQHYLEQD
jgi:hypothetical protein